MKPFNEEDFNKDTQPLQKNSKDLTNQKYNDPRVIRKRNETNKKIDSIRKELKK